ncbi:hypothetical protein MKX01_015208 [Papaver californicum]|nr:hypothetical protein MKX01_015208 [Papaver californicum]
MSDDESGNNPQSPQHHFDDDIPWSPEYTPATPPRMPTPSRVLTNDDPFLPTMCKPSVVVVTYGDSAMRDPAVAREMVTSGMLPDDIHFYDFMSDVPQAIDRAMQLHFAGLSVLRRVGELHSEFAVKRKRIRTLALSNYQDEIVRLRNQLEILQNRNVDVINVAVIRGQHDGARAHGYWGHPDDSTSDDEPYDPNYDPEEDPPQDD